MPTTATIPADLPASLRPIWAEAAERTPQPRPNLHEFRPVWRQHALEAQRLLPSIHVDDGGDTLYLGELSPGCRACKEGTWDCIFLTGRCNLACPFCCITFP